MKSRSGRGQKLATYQLSMSGTTVYFTLKTTMVYFGGKLISKGTYNSSGTGDKVSLAPVAADRLGSIGKFYPYGTERPSATANDTEKFTGYFRDAATGLDYADQRYHQPGVGRFMTPDPYGGSAKATDPGSWNRYAYSGADPVNNVDRDGRCTFSVSYYGTELGSEDGEGYCPYGDGGTGGFNWAAVWTDGGEAAMEAAYNFDAMEVALEAAAAANRAPRYNTSFEDIASELTEDAGNFAQRLRNGNISQPCQNDIIALGITADQWATGLETVPIRNGVGSTDLVAPILPPGPADIANKNFETVGQYFAGAAKQEMIFLHWQT